MNQLETGSAGGSPESTPLDRATSDAALRPHLLGKTREELQALLEPRPDAKLRAKQLAAQMYARAETDFAKMGDLPKDLREELAARYRVSPIEVADHRRSTDKVDKLLVHRGDSAVYECVLLPYEDRVSCCLSSQVGCPMGCTFCATGMGGFDRNLDAGEIIGQYLKLQSLSERRISHVVFMGMGEPMLNLDNLLRAICLLHEEVGLSYRHITISTVGLVPGIERMMREDLPVHLALSLHSPFDEVRDRLMPVNNKWPVARVLQAMREYGKSTGRKVTFEYLLIDGVNDTPEQARALAPMLKGFPNFVNLIPFNWVDTGNMGFRRPSRERVRAFRSILQNAGVNVTERTERGHDIAAACGQLAGMHDAANPRGKAAKRGATLLPVAS